MKKQQTATFLRLTRDTVGGDRLFVTDVYVANGHWVIRRDQLAPGMGAAEALGRFCILEAITDDRMAHAISTALTATREWVVTGELYPIDEAREARLAVATDGTCMYLAEHYCALLQIDSGETVYARDEGSVVRCGADTSARFLMPLRPSSDWPHYKSKSHRELTARTSA